MSSSTSGERMPHSRNEAAKACRATRLTDPSGVSISGRERASDVPTTDGHAPVGAPVPDPVSVADEPSRALAASNVHIGVASIRIQGTRGGQCYFAVEYGEGNIEPRRVGFAPGEGSGVDGCLATMIGDVAVGAVVETFQRAQRIA